MAMKVVDTAVSDSEIYSEIELDLTNIPKDQIPQVKQDVGEFLVEQILSTVAGVKSPVKGGEWEKKLSAEYRKKKKEEGYTPIANLEATGSLLSSLTYENSRNGIRIGVFDSTEAPIADGHNDFSGKSKIPTRQFLPKTDQEFIPKIQTGVEKIIQDYQVEGAGLTKQDFKDVSTKQDLYSVLSSVLGDLSRTELRFAALRSVEIVDILSDKT